MLPCCTKRSQVVPVNNRTLINNMATSLESSKSSPSLLKTSPNLRVVSPPTLSSSSSHLSYNHIDLTTKSEDYQFFQSIGIGCYGAANIVLSCHRPSRTVVVVRQVDLETLDVDKLEEIQNEMQFSSLLHHPNILSYHCSFVIDSMLWAIQPLMHYGSCADLMHSAKQFANGFRENLIALILRDVVKGLNYLHSLGYVHRSVRAKHFLIHESGIVKLSGIRNLTSMIDSGARKRALHGHFASAGDNICWLAPEVLAQDLAGYTYKSDIYSIGIAALELATGEAPFAGLPLTEIMMLKLRGHPPMLLRRQDNEDPIKDYTKTFFKVVDMCVDPNPHRRPNTTKLLSLNFLKSSKRKYSLPGSLKDLLLPVVPLNTESLTSPPPPQMSSSSPQLSSQRVSSPPTVAAAIDPPFNALTLDEPWLI